MGQSKIERTPNGKIFFTRVLYSEIKYSLKDSFLMYCSGLYLGVVTPGRMGEIAKALYLKKDGYSMGKSLVGAVLDRLADFIFL